MTRRTLGASAFWRMSETIGNEVVSFVAFTLLARLLAPDDFGAVALAGAVMVLLQVALYHGSTESLIQLPGYEPRHAHAALAANARLGAALAALGALAAWPMALWLGRPEFAHILWALLPSLLVRSLCSPMLAALRRQMDFRAIAIRTMAGVSVGGVVALLLAHAGAGPWSLVAQQWTSELVGFAVLAFTSPVKPWRAKWDRAALDDLLPVAMPVMGAQLTTTAARRLDTLAIGSHLGDHAVGIYFMVYRLVFAVQMVTQHALGELSLVVLSKVAGPAAAPAQRAPAVLAVLQLALVPIGVAFGLLTLLGPLLVPLLFGEAWREAAQPLVVMAAFAPAGALVGIVGSALVAGGHAHAFKRLSIGVALVQLIAIAVAARWGLLAVAWAVGLAQLAALPVALAQLARLTGIRGADMLRALTPVTLVYGLALGVAMLGVADTPLLVVADAAAFVGLMGGLAALVLRRPWRLVAGAVSKAQPGDAAADGTAGPTTPATERA